MKKANPKEMLEFILLAESWKEDTKVLSSITQKSNHPSYQAIILMGERAIPLILIELGRELNHWFWALHEITGENPVPEEDAGDLEKMREYWLQWGRERGLIQ